ncbi:hypothetical protein T439DRAFT_322474 [Meredithblackwellia eburnea MCA 4105]
MVEPNPSARADLSSSSRPSRPRTAPSTPVRRIATVQQQQQPASESSTASTSLQTSLGRGVPPASPTPASASRSGSLLLDPLPTTSSSPSERKRRQQQMSSTPSDHGTLRAPSDAQTATRDSIYSTNSAGTSTQEGLPDEPTPSASASISTDPFGSGRSFASVVGSSSSVGGDQPGLSTPRPTGTATGGIIAGSKGKAPLLAMRSASVSRARSKSRARLPVMEDEDEDEARDEPVRRPMSPTGNRISSTVPLDADDEVERRDRGEELVRQRMKDRARQKKEANRKRELESRTRATEGRRPSSSIPASTNLAQTLESFDPSRPPLDPTTAPATPFGGGFAEDQLSQASRSREPSRVGFRDPDQFGSVDTGVGHSFSESGYDTLRESSRFPAGGARSASVSTSIGRRPSYASTTGFVDDDENVFADRPDPSNRSVSTASVIEDRAPYDEEYDNGGGDEDEDEDIEDGDVEYTLKDRQDAINIEHPFGLPIWKPALYKKSRSVTRNAETALHATPSSTALRHLAPGNLIWIVLFGFWLFLVCVIVSAALWVTPWGGSKYGRVVWELGGYLLWPFGKYVAGWIDEDGADEDETPNGPAGAGDIEQAGSTYRGMPDSSTSTSRPAVPTNWNGLPDGPTTHLRTLDSERTLLNPSGSTQSFYGAVPPEEENKRSPSEETLLATSRRPHNFRKDGSHIRVRALGRTMYWFTFYGAVAPCMLLVCILCWALVFTIPMAKLLWVLLRHLNNEPLALHFHSPPRYATPSPHRNQSPNRAAGGDEEDEDEDVDAVRYPIRAGQRAPRISRESVLDAKAHGRLFAPEHSTVLLCTYHAAGLQYYKYTIDGVNVMFINLLSLVFFVIADFWFLEPWVEKHHVGGVLRFVSGQATIFVLALLSVIPLSYFIGMAVASISAQSSIGMGAVINASFGSIIEILLYCIALTQAKGDLVEGSIVGSILAGVLLMPGLSMIGGAFRRKEQRFNAKSAGVTSTMLIMAIIGILTPTLFYEIYGSFQLTCTGCDPNQGGTATSCKTCYYEHVDPVDDPFYKTNVRLLSYWCALILVLSYLIGLWFSLRTHASQIWQNAQPQEQGLPRPHSMHVPNPQERGLKRLIPSQLIKRRDSMETPLVTPTVAPRATGDPAAVPALDLPQGLTAEEFSRAFEVVNATAHAMRQQLPVNQALPRSVSHVREVSKAETEGHGGHDAPNWSRFKSASVLMSCTVLYAIIAEILVDVVDVVLDGSGIPEKFLGVTLFALVPNTTEFMNAISFAINGNIALSLEIGSAYALQVCLIQAPIMLAFSSFYGIGKEVLNHRAFTLVFPRWDLIAIIFSVFLLTYTYIEARANYYRGSILCLSYLALLAGFYFAPTSSSMAPVPGSLTFPPLF